LQAGHFLPGRSDTVLFDEEGCHCQCKRCNVFLAGAWPAYYRFMQGHVGQEAIEKMIDKWVVGEKSYSIEQLQKLEKYYQGKVSVLLARKG
jgi:hypothetical protein